MLCFFDAPGCAGGCEKRLAFITSFLKSANFKYIELLELCKGIDHLKGELACIEGLGGESLRLRHPSSPYEVGRSTTLLKVKTFHDAKAEVVGCQPGKGKNKGKLGALLMKLEDGTSFSLGTGFSDRERENPPAIGCKVTFRYQELTDGGVPRFPSFVRVYEDIDQKPTKGKRGK